MERPTAQPTLVILDFAGHVKRYDEPIEQAAAGLLALDGATRGKVSQIIDRRLATIDTVITSNLDLLVELSSAAGATKGEQFDLFVKGWEAIKPLRDQGPLRQEIRGELPKTAAAEFDRLLSEYWSAVVAEVHEKGDAEAKKQSRFQIVVAEQLQALGREIGASFQRLLKSGDLISAYLLRDLGLSDDQTARIRTMIANFTEKHGESSTKQQQGWLVVSVMAELTPDQRLVLAKRLRGMSK